MKQKQMKGVCLLIAGILFLLLFFSFSGIEKTKLLDTDGRNFEKAEVTNVISGNLSNSGSGKQTVELKLLSGDHKGKIIQATSSQSYFINIKLGIYNALYLFYFSSDDLQRNIPDTGGCISGRIYNSCDDVYG